MGPREEGAAITFWPNAFAVLDLLGCAEPLRKTHPLLDRRGPLQLLQMGGCGFLIVARVQPALRAVPHAC